jgi:hypothetical protein
MVTVVAAGALVPAAALAYQEPSSKDLGRVEARAGDAVSFELEGTDRGATWTARLGDGTELGGGSDSTEAPGDVGSFTVPDLGGEERDVAVEISVEHDGDGGDWTLSLTLAYRPASADSGSGTTAKPAPAPAPPPAPGARTSTRCGRRRPRRRSSWKPGTPRPHGGCVRCSSPPVAASPRSIPPRGTSRAPAR